MSREMVRLAEIVLLGSPLWQWLVAVAVAAACYAALVGVKAVVARRIQAAAGRSPLYGVTVNLVRGTHPLFLLVVALAAGTAVLPVSAVVEPVMGRLVALGLMIQGAFWASDLVVAILHHYVHSREEPDATTMMTAGAFGVLLRALVWTGALLLALTNLGVNVTALVAGLGVGSVAIALALQNVLGDLFASLAIVLDRPFVIGDLIIVDAFTGTVEHIGLKSTRVRSLDGELIVVSNADLMKSRIRNYKRMYERRILFSFGVTYDTPADTLEAIPGMVRQIISALAYTRFDRAHFKDFGASSLDFEVVYYVTTPNYTTYMDMQQAINLALVRRFAADGIEFAFPTRTVLLQPTGAAPGAQAALADGAERAEPDGAA